MPRISALAQATRLAEDDELAVVDVSESTTKKVPVGLIMPTGSIMDFAGSTPPNGWLLCYGQALDADTNPEYQDLYDVIGNTYGGSDNTDFVVPDLRGRVIAGKDNMGGSSANRLTGASGGVDGDVLGGVGGAETHTLTESEIPSTRVRNLVTGNGWRPTSGTYNVGGIASGTLRLLIDTAPHSDELATLGGGGSHNNVQPTIILNKIIKY